MRKISTLMLGLFTLLVTTVQAQIQEPVKCETSWVKVNDSIAELRVSATIDDGWHMYSTELGEGPVSASVQMETLTGARLDGKLTYTDGVEIKKFDEMFDMEVRYFEGKVTFVQRVVMQQPDYRVAGYFEYGACNSVNCLPPTTVDFSYGAVASVSDAASEDANVDSAAETVFNKWWTPVIDILEQPEGTVKAADQPWWIIFITGFVGGLLALVTPCVWPIIPMTVSFFLKRGGDKRKGRRDAYIYGASIVVIYVVLGLLVTLIFGASALNALSTAAIPNLFFCLLLIVFAFSFMGAFEITLPASWTNSIDGKAEKTGGILGIFLMAFTLTLVSFSCTGPIIGFLLVEVSTSGDILAPTIGMLGFAIALALPFTLFAIFPSWLKSAPKSGGWMNTVKVVLAFIELGFALKFFSVADLAYGWHLLDRETFLALWIGLAFLLGAYFLRWINFTHDDAEEKNIGVTRFSLALISFAFAIYMIPGLWGAPLKAISAFAPPMSTQDFSLYDKEAKAQFNDFDQGMQYAIQEGKPVMLDFSGFGCVNCREMEQSVLADDKVVDLINNEYILVTLHVDDKTALPNPISVTENGKQVTLRTIGDKWSYLQRSKFGANAQPFYVLLDKEAKPLNTPRSYDENIEEFVHFLEEGMMEYKTR